MNKRGQVTLFIIIAIVLVGSIILIAALRKPTVAPEFAPEIVGIDQCIKQSIESGLEIMLPQGGYIAPENYQSYEGKKVAFLCYNAGFYKQCINQEPAYIEHLEKEIKTFSESKISDCFYAYEQDYKKRGYDVQSSAMELGISIEPKRIRVLINETITITKGEEIQKFNDFNVNIASNLYGLARVAIDIVDQEARFCTFEYVGYMLVHPEFDITKISIGTESGIYAIKDKKTGQELDIGIRSCAFPPSGF